MFEASNYSQVVLISIFQLFASTAILLSFAEIAEINQYSHLKGNYPPTPTRPRSVLLLSVIGG